ncbi:hypothetical protein CPLU01_02415 [Colletotrichum plurivorum]|uniref:Uncharacterized protein n=1 Tax=Colletotrichum plurivorum TaxID=2175906 RepID=A0A8H6KVU1_9PEZI|nr:hypothetical protein CPLU01_02415 [Colletotrichum plurivorum]
MASNTLFDPSSVLSSQSRPVPYEAKRRFRTLDDGAVSMLYARRTAPHSATHSQPLLQGRVPKSPKKRSCNASARCRGRLFKNVLALDAPSDRSATIDPHLDVTPVPAEEVYAPVVAWAAGFVWQQLLLPQSPWVDLPCPRVELHR